MIENMNIAILDDDIELNKNIKRKLEKNWYHGHSFVKLKDFLQLQLIAHNFDLYIIDLGLKDGSWFDAIKYIRKVLKINTPILISSSYTEIEKKVYWLDLWADDYISKPFIPDEFLARIRSAIRRGKITNQNNCNEFQGYILDEQFRNLSNSQTWESIFLREKEFIILSIFIKNIWNIVSKETLLEWAWGKFYTSEVTDNTMNVTLSKLRKKLPAVFDIQTIIWIWYILKNTP